MTLKTKQDYFFYQFPFGICYLADRGHFDRLWSASSFLFLTFWVQQKDMGKMSPTGGLLSHFWTPAPTNTHNQPQMMNSAHILY